MFTASSGSWRQISARAHRRYASGTSFEVGYCDSTFFEYLIELTKYCPELASPGSVR